MAAPDDPTWIAVPGVDGGGADCEHESVAQLGADTGANEYYRCEACQTVLVQAGGGAVDHEEIREQRQMEEPSDNPLAGALSFDTGADEPGRTPGTGSPLSASSLRARLRSLSDRLFR